MKIQVPLIFRPLIAQGLANFNVQNIINQTPVKQTFTAWNSAISVAEAGFSGFSQLRGTKYDDGMRRGFMVALVDLSGIG